MERKAGLQILRVMACAGVFLCHLGAQMEVEGGIEKVMDFGARGVYLFFILSGFWGFHSRELESENGIRGCLRYWVKRAFKILPLYYAVIIYNFVLYEWILQSTPVDTTGIGWARYFFFLSTFIPADKTFWGNLSYTWTISIFVLFYLLVPFMRRIVRNFNGAVILWGGLYFLSLVCINRVSYGTPFFFLHYFAMGIVLYYAVKEEKIKELIVGCVVFACSSLIVNASLTHAACSMFFLILIVAVKEIKVENEKMQKWITILDSYSYTVYLMHAVVMNGIEMLKNRYPLSQMTILLIAFGCTIVGTVAAYHMIERPMQKVGQYILNKL